ncbi:MAG: DNA primase [Nitrososphaera sp.]
MKMGTADLAKYPFLREAGNYMRESGFGWEELGRPDMKDIIDRAVQRVQAGLSGDIYDTLERYEVEILTFLVSLIIVKSVGLEPVLKKYALAEARRAEKFLTEDLRKQSDDKNRSLVTKIFDDLFSLRIDFAPEDPRLFKVRVSDYLSRSSHFHEQEWKLINRLVQKGYVYLDADETVRLVRNELSVLICDKVRAMTLSTLPQVIKDKANDLRTKLAPRYQYRPLGASGYPPCVKHALDIMSKGENLPHSARVMLGTYMLAIGKPTDEIVALFQNAPDFNEKITRYQVEHLAGLRGSRTRYSVPSCEKLANEDLCFATEECAGIVNPVQFGRKRRQENDSH